MVSRYQKHIPSPEFILSGVEGLRTGSGPRLDRVEVHVDVTRVECEELSENRQGESSAAIRGRVEVAREQKH